MVLENYIKFLGIDDIPENLKKYLSVPSLVRLKNVGYFCGMDYASKNVYDFKEKVSRYDHSLTVALITWNLTKDIKQTLAALFHDISTPCFSHVIDYMNKDYVNQESTEEKTEEIIKNDLVLLEYLKSDGISVEEICDFKKYSIVDLDRPMMCADRLDGIILTGLFWTKSISLDDAKNIISSLYIYKNEFGNYEISFYDEKVAKLVLETNNLIDIYCHSKEDNYLMELLANITRLAINNKIVTYDELFIIDEEELMERLEKYSDTNLQNYLNIFKTITLDEIPDIDMPLVKVRKLNPVVNGKRLS